MNDSAARTIQPTQIDDDETTGPVYAAQHRRPDPHGRPRKDLPFGQRATIWREAAQPSDRIVDKQAEPGQTTRTSGPRSR